jgi:hypothetical protein
MPLAQGRANIFRSLQAIEKWSETEIAFSFRVAEKVRMTLFSFY